MSCALIRWKVAVSMYLAPASLWTAPVPTLCRPRARHHVGPQDWCGPLRARSHSFSKASRAVEQCQKGHKAKSCRFNKQFQGALSSCSGPRWHEVKRTRENDGDLVEKS